MKRVIVATSNAGKLRDLTGAAASHGIEICELNGFASLPAVVEDGATFEENAIIKARHYGRHVDGLTLRNFNVHSDEPDGRPAVILDDVGRLQVTGFDSTNIPPHQPLLLFQNVVGALLYGNRASMAADVFLSVLGPKSAGISLRGNDLRLARQALRQSSDVPREAVSIEADGSSSR